MGGRKQMVNMLKSFDVKGTVKDVLGKIDDSTLTMQEKAVQTVEAMERLGMTPSSVTRRKVTIIQIVFIMTCFIVSAVVYYFSKDYAGFIRSIPIDYGANGIIQTINAFFYGGYYLSKNISPAVKARLERKKKESDIKHKEAEAKLERDKVEDSLKIETKRNRIQRRERKRY